MLSFLLAAALAFSEADARIAYNAARELVDRHTPRDSGTASSRSAALFIVDKASALGADAKVDSFTAATPKGPRIFSNVEASFISGPSNKWVVVVSHFDTKEGVASPGANDGASTTGVLVALAGRLFARKPRNVNVLLLWTDGEECMDYYSDGDGLWGARHAAAKLKSRGANVRAVVNVDMLGDRDLNVMMPVNSHIGLRRFILDLADKRHPGKVAEIPDLVTDDHVPFMEAGYRAVNLIDFEYGSVPGANDYWHTPKDTIDKISEKSLLFTGRLLADIIDALDR